jgi:hypothetical protein
MHQRLSSHTILFVDCVVDFYTKTGGMLTGSQIRGALGLLGKDTKWLAAESGLSWTTVRRAVLADGVPTTRGDNLDRIQRALENAGCIFLDPSDSRPGAEGVRLRR